MEEQTLRELLLEYFGKDFYIESIIDSSLEFKCKIQSEDDVENFINFYSKETNETLKLKFKKKDKPKSIYSVKATYRCHHNTRYEGTRDVEKVVNENPSKRFRNTNCPFQMTFKVLKQNENNPLSCFVSIEHRHDHNVNSLEALSFRMISSETKTEIDNLFSCGMTPSQAYTDFLRSLRHNSTNDLDYHIRKADRSKCPRRRDFNSLYIKFCKEKFGGRNGVEMFDKLEERIEDFKQANEGTKIVYQLYDRDENSALILAIVTPLMQRIHTKIRQSSELVFIDSTSNLNEHNLRFFLLLTHSVCGALPLGIIITSDEQEQTLKKAFKLLKSILPEDSFFNSPAGPSVIMTDNCDELHNGLKYNWPQTRLLLCTFHILQQVWRWLYEKNHGVSKDDRLTIMHMFRQIIYADDEEVYLSMCKAFFDSDVVKKYKLCHEYFTDLCNSSERWARCFRRDVIIRGNNTNNYVEAQFLVVKDSILRRQRQYNINMLLDKLMVEFEEHFKRRLLSVADGTFDGIYSQRFKQRKSYKSIGETHFDVHKSVEKLGTNLFKVESKTTEGLFYTVDMAIGTCECPTGLDGSPCWHQYCLWSNGISSSINFLPHFNGLERQMFAEIAIGESLEISFYDPLHCGNNEGIIIDETQETDVVDKNNEPEHEHGEKASSSKSSLKEKASEMFENFCCSVKEEINSDNKEFHSALIKFVKKYESFSDSQKISSLQSFGSTFFGRARSRIKVQPTAVSRRKSKIGSRQKQNNAATKMLPNRLIGIKRKHSIKEVVDQNVPSAKKAGRSMCSNTKYFKTRK